jgi:hypothetical protein
MSDHELEIGPPLVFPFLLPALTVCGRATKVALKPQPEATLLENQPINKNDN